MHLDTDAARDSMFGELVASSWQTLSVTMRLMVRSTLFASGQVIGVGVDHIKWLAPVRPGDRLRVRAEITGKRESQSRPDQGLLFVRVTTLAERAEGVVPVASEDMALMVPRRPQASGEAV